MGKNTSRGRGPKRNPTAEKIRSNSRLLSDRHSCDGNGLSSRSSAARTRSDGEEGATVAGLAASRRNPTRSARKRTIEEEDENSNNKNCSDSNKRSNGGRLYAGVNKCGATSHGLGGILLSNAAGATEETTPEAAVDGAGADEEVQSTNLFDGSAFQTSNNKRIDEDEVRRDLDNAKSTEKLKQLIEATAGPIISHPVLNSPEHNALVGIIHNLLEEGHIEAISAESKSPTDPKFTRSSLEMIGTHKKILDQHPPGYCVAKTARGAKVLKRLGLAVAANNEAVGASGAKSHVYELIWNGVPISYAPVGPTDEGKKVDKEDAALVIGEHPDQNKADDPTDYTARECSTTGPDFNLDQSAIVVWMDNGKQRKHKLGTITHELKGNYCYYLSHWGSGRAAIAQTTWNGKPALILLYHRVWLHKKDKASNRTVTVNDHVFPTKQLHDNFLAMVDPTNSTKRLSRRYNNLTKLCDELKKEDSSLKKYIEDGNLTIQRHVPCSNGFNLRCSTTGCSNNACALDLQQIDGRDNNLSGEALRDHLQTTYDKGDLATHRVLCDGCASSIMDEEEVLNNICLSCFVRPKLAGLQSCATCTEYTCIGVLVDGKRKYACEAGGVRLDETNIQSYSKRAQCIKCMRVAERASSARRNKKKKLAKNSGVDEAQIAIEKMRAIYQLKDPVHRGKEENKQFIRGDPSSSDTINWPNATDNDTGYGPLKGGDSLELRKFYNAFRNPGNPGEHIATLAQYDAFIKEGGKVGKAARGRKLKEPFKLID